MGRALVIAGLVIAAISPAAFGILVSLPSMPGCEGGNSPTSGCILFGLDISWLVHSLLVVSLGFFILIPLGFVLFVVGIVTMVLGRRKGAHNA